MARIGRNEVIDHQINLGGMSLRARNRDGRIFGASFVPTGDHEGQWTGIEVRVQSSDSA